MAVEVDRETSGEPNFVLLREDVGRGCRWTLPNDGAAIVRASRIVTICAFLVFLLGIVVLLLGPTIGSDVAVPTMTGLWIVGIILALAAAHWRAIAGEPMTLEVQPESLQLFHPAQLWGRTQRWPVSRVRKLFIVDRGKDIPSGRPIGNLWIRTRWRCFRSSSARRRPGSWRW